MVKKIFKKNNSNTKIDALIEKYNIPRAHLSTNRRNVANALLIGVFFGMIPMPFQMVAVIAMVPFFRFNAPIAIGTVWISNPFTMPFIYYIEYLTGSFFLGTKVGTVELSIQWFSDNLKEIFVPLYVGAMFYAIVLSILTYFFINYLWIRSVQMEKKQNDNKRS